jgi:hypothetical protein
MNFYYVSAIRSSFGDYIEADTALDAVAKFRLAWGDDTHGAISARVAVYGEDECSGIFYNDGRHDCISRLSADSQEILRQSVIKSLSENA